jgi:methylmalonyl-CoA mutase cobalamin-binding subunit
MSLLRFLMIVLTVMSTSLAGAMAASHAPSADIDVNVMTAMSGDHTHCCEDTTDLAQSCHVLPALVMGGIAPEFSGMELSETGILLTGIKPSGLLDPPRAV